MEITKERIYEEEVKERDPDNYMRHRSRYEFAKKFIADHSLILDCACGSGYGSMILTEYNTRVIGVDASEDAINYAKEHYEGPVFTQKKIEELEYFDNAFDAIVSLETFEHLSLEAGTAFLANIKKWIKVGGVVILSSPMLRYKDGQPYVTNPFHVNEMPKNELLNLIHTTFNSNNFLTYLFHQKQTSFSPLLEENTGFCIMVSRRIS